MIIFYARITFWSSLNRLWCVKHPNYSRSIDSRLAQLNSIKAHLRSDHQTNKSKLQRISKFHDRLFGAFINSKIYQALNFVHLQSQQRGFQYIITWNISFPINLVLKKRFVRQALAEKKLLIIKIPNFKCTAFKLKCKVNTEH